MDEALLDVVLARVDRVPLAEEEEEAAASLLLAACEGDDALTAELSGEDRGEKREAVRADAEPAGAYLRTITVSGFRGVGPVATLELEPGPGLTVVVGRNGSGKSTFADGLEVLLTGNLRPTRRVQPTALSVQPTALCQRRWPRACRYTVWRCGE
jgi:hypothetical protein